MPRRARVILKNTAHHVVQRGHNRQVVFAEAADYRYYLATLKEWKQALSVKIYDAYCLMTNHVHLVLDPEEDETSIGKLMKRLAGRQTRYVNYLERRTGSLWEGRYKFSPIETETYLLACCRYVEMNPVRAGMVDKPGDYRWSSYRQKVGLEELWIDEDDCYQGLAREKAKQYQRYRHFVLQTGTSETDEKIRTAYRNGWVTGTNRFLDEIEGKMGIRIENRKRGRPRKYEK